MGKLRSLSLPIPARQLQTGEDLVEKRDQLSERTTQITTVEQIGYVTQQVSKQVARPRLSGNS